VDNARIILTGGPFDGIEAFRVPPDTGAPLQIVWSGWHLDGFTAWLYEWHGEVTTVGGRTDALIYRPTGRRLAADEIPPLVAEDTELWAGAAALIVEAFDVPAELIWRGL
jgi:hypothetical protein